MNEPSTLAAAAAPTARTGWRWPVWLLGALVALSCGLFAWRVSQRGRFSVPYSTHGAGPEGTRALYRLVGQLGFRAQRLSHEIGSLELGTLLAIGDPCQSQERALLRPEREELLRWVEAGGLLIVAGSDDFVPESSGLAFDPALGCQHDSSWLPGSAATRGKALPSVPAVLARPVGPPLSHGLPFSLPRARTLHAGLDSHATILIESEQGPLGLTSALGRGRVVLLGVSDGLTNQHLAEGGGAVIARLLKAFAPRGPVWFDEYHLGMGERRSLVQYLRERGFSAGLLQAAAVLCALLLAHAARLGRVRALATAAGSETDSYPSALARLYEQSEDRNGALEVLARQALRRIAQRYRASGVEPEAVPHWLEQMGMPAVAVCAHRIASHAKRPLERGESLLGRAREIDADLTFAIALSEAG